MVFEIDQVHLKHNIKFMDKYFRGRVTVTDNKKTLEILQIEKDKFEKEGEKIKKIELERNLEYNSKGEKVALLSQMIILLKSVNVSVIMNYKEKSTEVLNISMTDLKVLQQDNGKSKQS